MSKQRSPLPISAYSIANALGANADEVAASLSAGRSGLTPADPAFELTFDTFVGAYSGPRTELEGDLAPWSTPIARLVAKLVDDLGPAVAVARERWGPDRIGVLMGTSTAGATTTELAYKTFVKTGSLPFEYDYRRQHTFGAVLHVVAQRAGVNGPAWMVSTACTSSSKPLASAKRLIEAGIIDAAIVGGCDTLCNMTLSGFNALGALSHIRCTPFSEGRTGINIGEGGALMLVERDCETPLAMIEGVGESSDAYHVSAPHPEGLGAQLAMQRALDEGGRSVKDVHHINAHGTGTKANDGVESRAIDALFGREVPVISTKGYCGHTLGAAGACEAIFGLLTMKHGWVPPSIGADPLDPKIEIHVPTTRIDGSFSRVISNSFAFGGNNISVLLSAV